MRSVIRWCLLLGVIASLVGCGLIGAGMMMGGSRYLCHYLW